MLDASVAAAWFFRDQADSYSEGVLELLSRQAALVPALFVWEIANVVLVAERRKRISRASAASSLDELFALPIEVAADDPIATIPALTVLARDRGLSAYDTAYLELAVRKGLPLATRDAALRKAARAAGVADAMAAR